MRSSEIPELIQSTIDIIKSVLRGKTIDLPLRNRMLQKVHELERVIQRSVEPQIFINGPKGGEDRE